MSSPDISLLRPAEKHKFLIIEEMVQRGLHRQWAAAKLQSSLRTISRLTSIYFEKGL